MNREQYAQRYALIEKEDKIYTTETKNRNKQNVIFKLKRRQWLKINTTHKTPNMGTITRFHNEFDRNK